LEVKRAWKVGAGLRVRIWSNQEILNGPCFSADLPDFQVKIQSKFGDLQSFARSSAFCNFLIWAPFLGQPWTNLIFSFWFLVAQSDWKIDFLKIPQMIHQNSLVLQNPKNSPKSHQKKFPFHPPKKSIKTHQIFLQNPQKVAAQKNRLNFPKE
jgi:hypothetical protein